MRSANIMSQVNKNQEHEGASILFEYCKGFDKGLDQK